MAIDFIAWHDRTTANHKETLDKVAAQGYRTVSLCVYGDRNDPRYAAVAIKRPTIIATKQFFGMTLTEWQSKFNEMAAQGWGPYIVSATGARNDAVVAAVFKPMNPIPRTRHDLTISDLAALNEQAWKEGLVLAWVDAYGTPDDVRYIAVWHPNAARLAWNMSAINTPADANTLQQRFNAVTAQGGRPAHIAITPANKYIELYVDDTISGYAARADMTSEMYQKEFNKLTAQGLAPICVAAQGVGANARFAAIFANSEQPVPRTFRATGSASIASIDSIMEKFLKAHALRGGSLAITQGTRLVYARGYTHAESNYSNIQPTTLFRLASVSKLICAIATYQLIQEKKLTLETTMQSILQLKTPDGKDPVDTRFKDITIRHLLESTNSLPRWAMWGSAEAAAAFKQALPATPMQLASYIASLNLESAPGDPNNVMYNNTGYFMLSQVVAKLRGTSTFEAAINSTVLQPLGIKRIRGSRSLLSDQASDEARYHLSNILRKETPQDPDGLGSLGYGSSIRNNSRPLVPWQYGAEDYEMFDGSGGLSAAVTDLARVVAALSLRDNNPMLAATTLDAMFNNAVSATATLKGSDRHGYHGFDWANAVDTKNHVYHGAKGGWLSGNQSGVIITTGGLSYIIAINGNTQNDVPFDWYPEVKTIAEATNWGNTDLFPQFGMPAFAPSPLVSAMALPKVDVRLNELIKIQRESMLTSFNKR